MQTMTPVDYKILNYIKLDKSLEIKLKSLDKKNQQKVLALKDGYFQGHIFRLAKQNKIIKLAVALKAAEKTLRLYHKLGINEDVFKSTFDDIRIWCENCGNDGLDNIGWIKNHIMGNLFRIGRLQYQMFTFKTPCNKLTKLPFSTGERLIYVHIPQGEKLDFDACQESLRMANEFFNNYFPQYKYEYYFCESWLLYKHNTDFMYTHSNIVKFMSLFNIHYSRNNEDQAFERIFSADRKSHPGLFSKNISTRMSAIQQLPEQTSLQRAAKQYLLNGNTLGVGIATICKNSLEKS